MLRAQSGRPMSRNVLICGAAGRDFHNFNVAYRDDPAIRVVAFTATQIPGIETRRFPAALAGSRYPEGIPIYPEASLETLCRDLDVHEVVFAYSDVPHAHVLQVGSRALAAGADFTLLGPDRTMLRSTRPVVSVCAVRTGCGKSQVARYLCRMLSETGRRTAAIRHPMPYGHLERQAVQRFARVEDLDAAACTLEEREEYEPHIEAGGVVFAGVDYAKVLKAAEDEADVILWDGGNNDFSFLRPDVSVVVVDALRPNQLDTHHPGTAVLRAADIIVINKVHAATRDQLTEINAGLDRLLPHVPRVQAASPVSLEAPEALSGARVLIVEDGPTITHGGMPHGAGYHAVHELDVAQIVDPRDSATPDIARVYEQYPHIGSVLPAMGYSAGQLAALAETIRNANIDVVVSGTPLDLARAIDVGVPVVRARYAYADAGDPGLLPQVLQHLA